jgi:uncharacterized delta-60 repeat protein
MKKVLVLLLGTVLAVACGKTELPANTDLSANGSDVNSQSVLFPPATCTFLPAMLDTTFGSCGRVLSGNDTLASLAVEVKALVGLPDGKTLIAGAWDYMNKELVVARLNSNGSPDTSFGVEGFVKFFPQPPYFDYDHSARGLHAMQVLSDGKILLAGYFDNYSGFIARLNSDGTYDFSFNNGQVSVYPSLGYFTGMALQPDGKIVTVGSVYGTGRVVLNRFNSDGSYDFDFQQVQHFDGVFEQNFDIRIFRVVVLSSGRILAIRNTKNGPTATAFDANGLVDTWFGNAGSAAPWKPAFRPGGSGNTCTAPGTIQQSDDKIIMAGGCNGQFAMARINADGSLDSSFGTFGKVSDTSMPAMNAVTLRSDGRIVVGGNQNDDFLLVGYNANGSKDSSWGNGRVVTGFPQRNGIVPVDTVTAVTVAADGKIIAAGSSYTRFEKGSGGGFAVARFRP